MATETEIMVQNEPLPQRKMSLVARRLSRKAAALPQGAEAITPSPSRSWAGHAVGEYQDDLDCVDGPRMMLYGHRRVQLFSLMQNCICSISRFRMFTNFSTNC